MGEEGGVVEGAAGVAEGGNLGANIGQDGVAEGGREGRDGGEELIALCSVIGDNGDAEDGLLERIEGADLCERDMQPGLDAVAEASHDHALVFEGAGAGDVEGDASDADEHVIQGGWWGPRGTGPTVLRQSF